MVASARSGRGVLLAAALLGGAACEPDPDPPSDCPDGELFVSDPEHCEETWCGDPVLEAGTGNASRHAELSGDDGEPVPIVRGPQGGYHLWVSVATERLCPVIFVRPRLFASDAIGGAETLIYESQLHVQAVRPQPGDIEYQEGHPSWQAYWGIRGNVPCEFWPDDREDDPPSCGEAQSSLGYIEDFAVRLEIEAEDHNGRVAVSSSWIQPECCQR